ncbi:inactive serine protease 35 [Alosa sapidissima]|uniref:inactive serine protease 35 n=1 Tax=Alosa sapidissima TaxID=34773 RepID=UPI001C0917BE|nr:inactive serine protease 35 [Alosa sapidissima]
MMGSLQQALLICVTILELGVCGIGSNHGNWGETHTWQRAAVPLVVERRTVSLSPPDFRATLAQDTEVVCGIQCQQGLPVPDRAQLERLLAYETIYANGTRTFTEVRLQGADESLTNASLSWLPRGQAPPPPRRNKRQVFGTDGRFVISDGRFTASYPFSASVKLSSGCSGILVGPRHVLTAAHCVHDGQDYLKESRGLRVGVMRSRSTRDSGKVGRRRSQRKGGRRGRKGGDVETQDRREGSERQKRRRERKTGRGKRRREKARIRRGAAVTSAETDPDREFFRWTRVKQIHTPRGWMTDVTRELAADYDYALLELRRPLGATPMALGLVSEVKDTVPASRVHFTGFDHDQPGKAVYRFCSVVQESSDLLYQYCDARAGSSGAGVYVRLRDPSQRGLNAGKGEGKTRREGRWTRKVIGVFSGHQWVDYDGRQKDYNVAVRITPAKFAQICHWIHGDPKRCQQT